MELGIQWLELLGPVITNCKVLTMDFQWNDRTIHLIGESQVNDEMLHGKQLMKMSKSKSIVSLFHLKAMLPEDVTHEILDCVKPSFKTVCYFISRTSKFTTKKRY